jgi:hypothetical protein
VRKTTSSDSDDLAAELVAAGVLTPAHGARWPAQRAAPTARFRKLVEAACAELGTPVPARL